MDDITEPDAPRLKDLHPLDKQRVGQLIKRLSEERRQRQSAETQVSSLRAKHSQVIAEASSLRDKFQQSLELLKTYQSRLDTSKKRSDESAAMGSSAPAPSRVHACVSPIRPSPSAPGSMHSLSPKQWIESPSPYRPRAPHSSPDHHPQPNRDTSESPSPIPPHKKTALKTSVVKGADHTREKERERVPATLTKEHLGLLKRYMKIQRRQRRGRDRGDADDDVSEGSDDDRALACVAEEAEEETRERERGREQGRREPSRPRSSIVTGCVEAALPAGEASWSTFFLMDDITEPDAPRLKDLHPLDKQRVGQLIKRLSEERRQRQSAETQVSSLRAKHSQVIAEASSLRDKFQQSLELLKTYQSRLDTSKKRSDESAAMGSSAPAPSRVHACVSPIRPSPSAPGSMHSLSPKQWIESPSPYRPRAPHSSPDHHPQPNRDTSEGPSPIPPHKKTALKTSILKGADHPREKERERVPATLTKEHLGLLKRHMKIQRRQRRGRDRGDADGDVSEGSDDDRALACVVEEAEEETREREREEGRREPSRPRSSIRVGELLAAPQSGAAQWEAAVFDSKVMEDGRRYRGMVLGSEAMGERQAAAILLTAEFMGERDYRSVNIYTTESAPHDQTRTVVMRVLGDQLGGKVWRREHEFL
ncbi:unnamed protein product [Vitrella brassicaformis CCMP3155]|uniref:Uncharacterized protein n=1 Tax=Vitrella brassicaformis (strain CCMP3155) TaxID=1169540 RepID=A0A0G4G435_VITBC|nr:unnamed protein product [Vitrella brassicaformis CCMP3155]|eukprot:CEM22655.1 unnamed protein product [Vitrella brassicaformis CCMP3155]